MHVCIGCCFVAEVVYFLIASEEESLARSIKEPIKDVVHVCNASCSRSFPTSKIARSNKVVELHY